MRRFGLRDDQWERIADFLPGRPGHVAVTAEDNRLFVEAVLLMLNGNPVNGSSPSKASNWGIFVMARFPLSPNCKLRHSPLGPSLTGAGQCCTSPRDAPHGRRHGLSVTSALCQCRLNFPQKGRLKIPHFVLNQSRP